MHHHVFTFLTGDEQDITDLIPMVDDRPSQRQRTATEAAHMKQDNNRSFSIASWLDKEGDEIQDTCTGCPQRQGHGLGL